MDGKTGGSKCGEVLGRMVKCSIQRRARLFFSVHASPLVRPHHRPIMFGTMRRARPRGPTIDCEATCRLPGAGYCKHGIELPAATTLATRDWYGSGGQHAFRTSGFSRDTAGITLEVSDSQPAPPMRCCVLRTCRRWLSFPTYALETRTVSAFEWPTIYSLQRRLHH